MTLHVMLIVRVKWTASLLTFVSMMSIIRLVYTPSSESVAVLRLAVCFMLLVFVFVIGLLCLRASKRLSELNTYVSLIQRMDITSNRHHEVALNLRVAGRPPIPAGITEDRLFLSTWHACLTGGY